MKFSAELAAVFDKAAGIYYDSEEITCMNLVLAMAATSGSIAAELLGRLGLTRSIAESFFIPTELRSTISQNAEIAIKEAQKYSTYGFVCSHHLLRAIICLNYTETRQLFVDYGITAERVLPIIDAMCQNGVGKEQKGVRVARMTNKRIENQIKSVLKDIKR